MFFPASSIPHPAFYLLIAAQQSSEPVLERLDPPRRAAVIMALLGLTLIGLFLITFVMIGGHWVRRLARHRPGRWRIVNDPVTNRQFSETLPTILPQPNTGETILLDTHSKDTKVEK